jgi:hypothetical protein
MMRWLLLAVLAVALTATATVVVQSLPEERTVSDGPAFPAPQAKGPHPRAVVEGDPTYKFGSKAQHSKFEKDFVIKNEGDADLTLTLQEPPCSCTVAGFQDAKGRVSGSKVIPPKQQATIHFTWETRENNGHYVKPATLVTNDPEHPTLRFAADGEVYPAVVVFPAGNINFSEISTDEEFHTQTIAVFSPDHPGLKITEITSSRPELIVGEQAPLPEADSKGLKATTGLKFEAGRQVKVKVKRGLPLGAFLEELVIRTDHPKQPELKLTLAGKMVGPISLTPERARFFGISARKGGRSEVRINVRNHRQTHFEVVQKPDKFKVNITPDDKTDKPGRYLLTVAIPPGLPPGKFDDFVVLKTDHPHAGELRIPVGGFISDEN